MCFSGPCEDQPSGVSLVAGLYQAVVCLISLSSLQEAARLQDANLGSH